ncbi:RagB/SusD family nutrient uptake outer membrane protein [Pollutibacter soli]|uniref:RagB/SusD family nutrient uptake outer membrane protein n=1 Tax=Pollutibacter soli TaxID=3034157 RepID=UPI003013BA42
MKRIIYSLFAGSVLISSCKKDELDPIPQTQLSDAVAFSTPARVLQQVNGMYAAVKTGAFYAGRYQNYQDIRGEEFINQTNNGVTNFQTWNFTVTPTTNEVQNFWSAAYAAINRANVVMEGIAGSPIDDALKANYIAEGKFLRALSYYSLLQLYAKPYTDGNGNNPGVPLRLKAETSSGSNNLARSSVAEIYDQILKDLNEAETAIPANYSSADLNTTRAHKNSVIALKTRVYLSMGRYADVITEGNKLVPNSAPYNAPSGVANGLNATIASVFASPYNSKESIFSFPYQPLDVPGTQNSLNSYYNPDPFGIGDYTLNETGQGIVASTEWGANDDRRKFNIVTNGKLYLRKWPNNAGTNPDWVPVIRYSEVMLNLAEGLARQAADVDARALALLNAVRQRSDATATITAASKQELIDKILLERRIELLGEGFRTSDVTRTGASFGAKSTISAVPPSNTIYIWPISNAEMVTNKEMAQNPGY